MTAIEAGMLAWSGWPDAPPQTGPKPDYTTQKWEPPKRLAVWARPGRSGRITDVQNWQVFGALLVPGTKAWDEHTDAVLPACNTDYTAVGGVGEPISRSLNLMVRHMTIENGAAVSSQDAKLSGNLWIARDGALRIRFSVVFVGSHHTFIRNERPPVFGLGVNPQDVPRSAGYYLSQYIMVRKEPEGSVEFLGHFLSNDKFCVFGGTCILGLHSAVMLSNRNPDRVGPARRSS